MSLLCKGICLSMLLTTSGIVACDSKSKVVSDGGRSDRSSVGCGSGCPDPLICVPELGCVECEPGQNFCSSKARLMRCNAEGVGALLEACDLKHGVVCSVGRCVSPCEKAIRSNVGCEYWPVDLPQFCSKTQCQRKEEWAVTAANLNPFDVRIIVEQNEAQPGRPIQLRVVEQRTIPPNDLITIGMPQREVDGSTNQDFETTSALSSRAFRLTSSGPVVVYQLNTIEESDSIDASLLIPTSGLGTEHRAITWFTEMMPIPVERNLRSFVTVVGTAELTDVKVIAGGHIIGGRGVAETPTGGVFEITLGPFDVLNLAGTKDKPLGPQAEGDLSGTQIISSKPVAVYAGTSCAFVKAPKDAPQPLGGCDSCCCDHLEEQVPPRRTLGNSFAIARSPRRSEGSYTEVDLWRIIADKPDTVIWTNLPPPWNLFTVGDKEIVEFWSQGSFTLESSNSVLVAQFLVSQSCGAGTGDPSLTYIPPIEQGRKDYVFLVPPTYEKNYVVIVREQGTTVEVDGALPIGCEIEEIGKLKGTTWEALRCDLDSGVHTLKAEQPVTVLEYGYGVTGSIAYVAGSDYRLINPLR